MKAASAAAPLSLLHIAWPLASVALAAGLLLAWMPQLPADDGSLWMAALVLLLAVGGALAPLVIRLAARAAEADALAARTRELEVQLARALRQRNETLEKISHDLRTPLASMQGYLELLLLRQGQLDPTEAQNYLETAARHSARLARLVADLLELARLESEHVVLQCEPFPVAELAHDVVQRFAPAAARAQVRLEVDGIGIEPHRLPVVLAEVRLVERVLANLVDNALRHTPGGGQVVVSIENVSAAAGDAPAAGRARIVVTDNGAGIAPADLEGLFDRYANASRRGDSGRSTAGLGLAMARRIAALHGSTLELASRPGAGTRVTFTLPLAAPGAAKAAVVAPAPARSEDRRRNTP